MCWPHPAGFLQVNPGCAGRTLTGSSRFILVGLATLTGSSRLSWLCWPHPDRFLQVYSIPLLALTDGLTDGGTTTLASRGLEEPAHASRGLVRPEKKDTVVCLASARSLLRVRDHYYDRKKKIQLSVWRVCHHYYDRKKKIQSSVWRVHDHVCLFCCNRYICISST